MNNNYICVFDTETDSVDPKTCKLLEIGAVMMDNRSLEIVSEFSSLLKPPDLESVNKEALEINHITMEELEKAPETKVVWLAFTEWVQKYNRSKGAWSSFQAPIAAGFNIIGYDMQIIRRYSEKHGPWDGKRGDQKIFNQVYFIDLMHQLWLLGESSVEPDNMKQTTLLKYMGFPEEMISGSHRALTDATNCATILRRLIEYNRRIKTFGKMKDAFANKSNTSE